MNANISEKPGKTFSCAAKWILGQKRVNGVIPQLRRKLLKRDHMQRARTQTDFPTGSLGALFRICLNYWDSVS
jgi:hypothetical protein